MREDLFAVAAWISGALCAAILGVTVLSYFRSDMVVPGDGTWGVAFYSYHGMITIFRGDIDGYDPATRTIRTDPGGRPMTVTNVPSVLSVPATAALPIAWIWYSR